MKGALYAVAVSVLLGLASAGDIHEHRHAQGAFQALMRIDEAAAVENATCGLIQPPQIQTAVSIPSERTLVLVTSSGTSTSTSDPPPPPPAIFSVVAAPLSPSVASVVAQSAPSPLILSYSSSSSSSAPPIISGSQWCITYSPYTSTGACMNSSAIASDIASIAAKGFSSIRLYSTDCNSLSAVAAAAAAHGLKLVLGIYISDSGIAGAQDQVSDITSDFEGDYSMVEMVVVGNEAIFNNYCSGAELTSFILSVRSTLREAGYTGPVTTTEPMSTMRANAAELCDILDVVGANIHAFFNSDITAAQAGAFVSSSLEELATYCPGDKEVWNLETGWPSAGDANGHAVPGQQEQQIAIAAIVAAAGGKSAISSFVNDLWKAEGDLGVEQSWGCGHLFD
ncbi:hypothetical protein MMC18_000293 [Xylographa bjoerkii]|nr:hypothetical protein [Xylographa bjoerkii]